MKRNDQSRTTLDRLALVFCIGFIAPAFAGAFLLLSRGCPGG